MAKRGRKPLNRGWRLQQQNGVHGHGQSQPILHQQKYERLRPQRLDPEQIGSSVHDESDTISFRNHLLENYILASEWIDVLTTQAVPISRVKKPNIYPEELRLQHLEEQLRMRREQLTLLEKKVEQLDTELDTSSQSVVLKECIHKLDQDIFCAETVDDIQKKFETHFGVTIRAGAVIMHRDKFKFPSQVGNKAPDNYWTEVYPQILDRNLQEEREKLELEQLEKERLQQEEDLHQQQLEEEERKRKQQEEEERQLLLQSEAAAVTVTATAAASDQQTGDAQQGSEMLDEMFNDIGTEPFNTGFDDAFGDFDNAFF
ncbi:HFR042Wp [Eremothecium sinecaudum]|uniref:HFR042Wp n=1 Tax=Eremothecium sinecaudum TaxID=45286 RepID=A0A0X8HUW2_9SACH|nr:HFR042Wp [Eremothecium sinecaudum]AMD21897.1 HFR042Wp [Eremothecium sinecaudum]